jgi:hypothetical protein
MFSPEKQFPVGTYVRLRDGVDPGLYNGFSRTGNTGWIRKRKRDKYGYPQVYIEFDKDHWSYNGTEDGWTWQGQFEAVEEKDMAEEHKNNQDSLEDTVRGITENFVQAIFGAMNPNEQSKPEPPDVQSEPEEDPNKWETLAAETTESIANAPAYLVIALERVQTPGDAPAMIIPRVFYAAQKSEYALIVQSQLAHVLASLQDTTIAGVLEQQQAANEDA